MSSSSLGFSDAGGGLISLAAFPYDSSRGKDSISNCVFFNVAGTAGVNCMSQDSTGLHGLFEVWPRGKIYSPVTRNVNGLFFHHTPVYIGTDTGGKFTPDFTKLYGLNPDMGDDTTWMLAVNGPALIKELFIDDSDWPDYVLLPGYQLTPLEEAEVYMRANHHLPELPPASKMAKSGVPVGRTEAAITKQLEEAMLYIGELHDEVKELKAKVEELQNQKGK